jgi:hypothetical protein
VTLSGTEKGSPTAPRLLSLEACAGVASETEEVLVGVLRSGKREIIGEEIVSDRAPDLARRIESLLVSTLMQLITEFYHESS